MKIQKMILLIVSSWMHYINNRFLKLKFLNLNLTFDIWLLIKFDNSWIECYNVKIFI